VKGSTQYAKSITLWHTFAWEGNKTSYSLGSSSGFLVGGSLLGLLLLGVLGEELFVFLNGSTGVLATVLGLVLDDGLAAETGLGDHALDSGGLVEGLVSTLDFTSNNVLADIVLLFVEGEGLDDVVASLGAELVGALNVGDTSDLLVATLDNSKEDSGEVGVEDATTDGLSLAFTSAGGLVAGSTRSEQDTGSSVDEDSLLHLETLLVVTAGNSEDVALELFSHDIAFDLLTHSSVVEGTDVLFIVNFNLFLATGGGVANVKLENECQTEFCGLTFISK